MPSYCVNMTFWIVADSEDSAILEAHRGEDGAYAMQVNSCYEDTPEDV